MTPKEADEAARKQLPITFQNVRYLRISAAGYNYDEYGRRVPFVTLLDRNRNSTITVSPEKCELAAELTHGLPDDEWVTKAKTEKEEATP